MTMMFKPPQQEVFGGPRDRSYPAPLEMLHVSIFHTGPGIDDLVNFYQVALNMRYVFKVSYPNFEFIAISHDDENHRLGFVNLLHGAPPSAPTDLPEATVPEGLEPRKSPKRPCRIEHTSWLYPDFESVLLLAKRIHEELGVWPRTTRHGGEDLNVDYNDPDGNRVEMISQFKSRGEILFGLYQAAAASEDDRKKFAEVFMPVSMEKLVALYESGVPISDLKDREFCRRKVAEGLL